MMTSGDLKDVDPKAQMELDALRNILDSAGSYVYTKDIDSRYTHANSMTCQLFGASLDKIIEKDDNNFFSGICRAYSRERPFGAAIRSGRSPTDNGYAESHPREKNLNFD